MLKIHLNIRLTCAFSKNIVSYHKFMGSGGFRTLGTFSHVLGSQNAVWKYGTLGTFRNSHILRILWSFLEFLEFSEFLDFLKYSLEFSVFLDLPDSLEFLNFQIFFLMNFWCFVVPTGHTTRGGASPPWWSWYPQHQ